MDNNNSVMDTVDWRTNLQLDSRQRIVNKIADTLKKHLPFSGEEGLNEVMRMAERFEEKIFSVATSQSDYLRKISLKMLTMETKSQNTVPNSMPSNQGGTSNLPLVPSATSLISAARIASVNGADCQDEVYRKRLHTQNVMDKQEQQLYQAQNGVPPCPSSTSLDSTSQTEHPYGGDWQEEVYQKLKHMKEQYLPELSEMYQKIANKLMQQDFLPHQQNSEQFEKLKLFKAMLERAITFLQVPKSSIQPGYKEKLVSYEKQIINFVNVNKPRKTTPQMQQQQQPQQSQQYQITQVQPLAGVNGADRQDEVYRKDLWIRQ